MRDGYPWQYDLMKIANDKSLVYRWEKEVSSLSDQEIRRFNDWLCIAGGLPLENVTTDFELVTLAQLAPHDLLFGLAYGKFADVLAYPDRHNITLLRGQKSVVQSVLTKEVLRRGGDRLERMGKRDPRFSEVMTTQGSQSGKSLLLEQAARAPDAHCLGQLTSWLLTACESEMSPRTYKKILS